MPYQAVSMLSADRFYAVLGCFRMFFEMNWICLGPLVSIDYYENGRESSKNGQFSESMKTSAHAFTAKRNRCEDGSVQLVKYKRNNKQSVLV